MPDLLEIPPAVAQRGGKAIDRYLQSPEMQKALEKIRWKIPATMLKARKDAARGILRGEPCLYAMDLPLRIAQRYARRKAFLASQETKP
jgi:hypothetical protein